MNLPIDVASNHPLRFKWKQHANTPIGNRVVDNEGSLSPSVEMAVLALINLAKQQEQELIGLRKRYEGALETMATMSKRAEAPASTVEPSPRRKGNG